MTRKKAYRATVEVGGASDYDEFGIPNRYSYIPRNARAAFVSGSYPSFMTLETYWLIFDKIRQGRVLKVAEIEERDNPDQLFKNMADWFKSTSGRALTVPTKTFSWDVKGPFDSEGEKWWYFGTDKLFFDKNRMPREVLIDALPMSQYAKAAAQSQYVKLMSEAAASAPPPARGLPSTVGNQGTSGIGGFTLPPGVTATVQSQQPPTTTGIGGFTLPPGVALTAPVVEAPPVQTATQTPQTNSIGPSQTSPGPTAVAGYTENFVASPSSPFQNASFVSPAGTPTPSLTDIPATAPVASLTTTPKQEQSMVPYLVGGGALLLLIILMNRKG